MLLVVLLSVDVSDEFSVWDLSVIKVSVFIGYWEIIVIGKFFFDLIYFESLEFNFFLCLCGGRFIKW